MKKEQDFSLLIDRYMNGEMNKEELIWFDGERDNNKSLASELKLQYEIGSSILDDEEMDLRIQLGKIEKEILPKRVRLIQFKNINRSAAASVATVLLLLTMAAWLLWNQFNTISNDELFSRFYEPYPSLTGVRSGDQAVDYILTDAMLKYQEGDFVSALSLFEKVLNTNSKDATSRFYQGISYMETQKFKNAGNSFHTVIDHRDNLFIEQAQWYLALCYLRTDENTKATEQLNQIVNSKGFYSRDARRLLRAMR